MQGSGAIRVKMNKDQEWFALTSAMSATLATDTNQSLKRPMPAQPQPGSGDANITTPTIVVRVLARRTWRASASVKLAGETSAGVTTMVRTSTGCAPWRVPGLHRIYYGRWSGKLEEVWHGRPITSRPQLCGVPSVNLQSAKGVASLCSLEWPADYVLATTLWFPGSQLTACKRSGLEKSMSAVLASDSIQSL